MDGDDRRGSRVDEGSAVARQTPQEAFSLLGNETRIEILEALAGSPEEPLSFSELRERVGARDSGQFNYHLGKLADHFVRKTEEGYELTLAGTQIVGALRAGTYTADLSIEPIELVDPCPRCGGTIVVSYEDEHVRMQCRDCEEWGNQFTFPPGTVEQFEREELPAAFDRWLKTRVTETVAGFCPNCSGRLEGSLHWRSDDVDDVTATFDCERCGQVVQVSPRALLFAHPVATAFYYEHGLDVGSTPTWEIDRRTESDVARLDGDPPKIRLEVTVDDERLVVTVAGDASIERIERHQA